MSKIIINNVGPINHVDIDLKKINIIMGPQSSGKSTIAKIISYCQWAEKRYILDGDFRYKVHEQLLEFHRIGESYFSIDSSIYYNSSYITLRVDYKENRVNQVIVKNTQNLGYEKSKNIYIPSERNFVSVIPNLSKYKEKNDNIMSFVYDWYTAKRNFTVHNSFPILNLNVNFYNVEENDLDLIQIGEAKKEIFLREGSSGLQSLTPLLILIEYLTEVFYNENATKSVNEIDSLKQIISNDFLEFLSTERLIEIQESGGKVEFTKLEIDRLIELFRKRTTYFKTQFIIEEPEQNLFPETQRDLIYFLFEKLTSDRDHSLMLTTHSPYILYAINNCILGGLLKDKIQDDEKEGFLSHRAWISPNLVNILEIDAKTGTLKDIKDPLTGTVSKHYFNSIMNSIMSEYYELLSFLGDEKQD